MHKMTKQPKPTRFRVRFVSAPSKAILRELAYPYFLFSTINCTNELWICKPERDGDGLFSHLTGTSYHLLHHWCLTLAKLFVNEGRTFATLHLWVMLKWQIENPPQVILSKKSKFMDAGATVGAEARTS